MSDQTVTLELTRDQALVLFDFFARFSEDDTLAFAHVAEYLALTRVAAQLDTAVSEMFRPDYPALLQAARARVAQGYEAEDYPGPKVGDGR